MMKHYLIMALTGTFCAIYPSPYTITNKSNQRVRVVLQESFKTPEEQDLNPGDHWVKHTLAANCLDIITVKPLDKNNEPLKIPYHSLYAVCAFSGTICIVNSPFRNLVELQPAWTGISAEKCTQ